MRDDIESYTALAGGNAKTDSWFPDLSLKQKIVGMLACAILGFVTSILSYVILFAGSGERKMVGFAVLYTCGNLIAIMGTCFLWGFKAQFRAITHKKRAVASSMYFGSMLATIIVAFKVADPLRKLLLIILLIAQYAAYLWYSLSFIPFARTAVKAVFNRVVV